MGQFTNGPYSGGKIYAVYATDGIGMGSPYVFVRMPDNKDTLLERDGTSYYVDPGTKLPFTIDRDYAIPELQAPALLTSPDGKLVLERQPRGFFAPAYRWEDLGKNSMPIVKVFTDPV